MGRKQSAKNDSTAKIESLLQRLKRHGAASGGYDLPPDQAGATLGRHLGEEAAIACSTEGNNGIGDKIFEALLSNNANPSVSHAYFSVMATPSTASIFQTSLPRWILRCEELCVEYGRNYRATAVVTPTTACFEIMSSAIQSYAKIICNIETVDVGSIYEVFSTLKLATSRACWIRHFVMLAFSPNAKANACTLLSPLMAASVLTISSSLDEKMLFLQEIWRPCRMLLWSKPTTETTEKITRILQWMTTSLDLFLCGIQGVPKEQQPSLIELANQWLLQLVDMAAMLFRIVDGNSDDNLVLSNWAVKLVGEILPYYATTPIGTTATCRFPLQPVLSQLEMLNIRGNYDPLTIFRMSIMALTTPAREDTCSMMNLIGKFRISYENSSLIPGIVRILACIFAHNESCQDSVQALLQYESGTPRDKSEHPERVISIVQLFDKHSDDDMALLKVINSSLIESGKGNVTLSAVQQNAALVLGVGLLYRNEDNQELVYDYLQGLLEQCPNLGIQLFPVLADAVQVASKKNDAQSLLRLLEFLCDALVQDPTCAQQVWDLIGNKFGSPGVPDALRSSVLRLYPRLCRSNKRLYRRVCDSLGSGTVDSPTEVRVAVAATLADLAKEDRIRDVSDVIGWIQTFLSDEHPSVVHFALLSLHYMVVAEELDFSLVIKVLKKKLCPITTKDVLKLPDVSLEALVILLGDGECSSESSSGEDDDSDNSEDITGVSPQVTEAVGVLVELAESMEVSMGGNDNYSTSASLRIRQNVYDSISRYSLQSLGVSEDGIRNVISVVADNAESKLSEEGERYEKLTKIVTNGMEVAAESQVDENYPLLSTAVVSIANKLVANEEELLGSSLWQKGGKTSSSSKKTERTQVSKNTLGALPLPTSVRNLYNKYPSTPTAIASLLCFQTESTPADLFELLEQLSDIANDVCDDASDPVIMRALGLGGWVCAIGKVWSAIIASEDMSKEDALKSTIEAIRDWRDILQDSDNAFLALAVLAIYIPDTFAETSGVVADIDMSRFVDEIHIELMDAQKNHLFENQDVANICLGLIGLRALNSRSMSSLDTVLNILMSSVADYGSNVYYSLAIIGQALPLARKSAKDSGKGLQRRLCKILGKLTEELFLCLESQPPEFTNLVACIKSGRSTADLVLSIAKIQSFSCHIHDSMRQKARSLFLALGLCVPTLSTVDVQLLLASYRCLEKFAWGSGKSLAMPSVLFACMNSGVLGQRDLDTAVEDSVAILEDAWEKKQFRTIDDGFYALNSMAGQIASSGQQLVKAADSWASRLLEVDNLEGGFESQLLWMLSTSISIGSLPYLGIGSPLFYMPAQLDPASRKERITGIVQRLTQLSNNLGESNCRDSAALALGLLSSIKISASPAQRSDHPLLAFGQTAVSTADISAKSRSRKMNFSRIPQSPPGTCLATITRLTQFSCENNLRSGEVSAATATPKLATLLNCFTTLSLPSQFATDFIEPLLNDIEFGSSDTKFALVKLLISQLTGRRKASFDGRDYLNIVMRISSLPRPAFRSILGETGSSAEEFMLSLPNTIFKFPTEAIGSSLQNLWQICCDEFREGSKNYMTSFLSSLHRILQVIKPSARKKQEKFSPKSESTIRRFTVDTVLEGFCTVQLMTNDDIIERFSMLEIYILCLKEVPTDFLDETNFAVFTGSQVSDKALIRIICIMVLARSGYFTEGNRRSSEISKAVAWFARQQLSAETIVHGNSLRRVAFEIALSAAEGSSASMQDALTNLLESLLLVTGDNCTLCVEFLAILMGCWCQNKSSTIQNSLAFLFVGTNQQGLKLHSLHDSTLQSILEMFVHDLPWNLSTFCHISRSPGLITKQIWRICKNWSEQGAPSHNVECLQKILCCCRAVDTSEQDFASLSMSLLTANACC